MWTAFQEEFEKWVASNNTNTAKLKSQAGQQQPQQAERTTTATTREILPKELARDVLQELARMHEKSVAYANATKNLIPTGGPGTPQRRVVDVKKEPGSEDTTSALSEEDKRRLYEYYARANELLRHFWASYPITSKALASKVPITHRYHNTHTPLTLL